MAKKNRSVSTRKSKKIKEKQIDRFKRIIDNIKTAIGNLFWSKITLYVIMVTIVILLFTPFSITKWITYNTYKTAYQLSDSIYCNYFIEYFLFFRLFFICLIGFGIYLIIKELKDQTISKKRKFLYIVLIIPLSIVPFYALYGSLLHDLEYVKNNKYFIAESDLSRYRALMSIGGRGGRRISYYLYLYDPNVENKDDTIKRRKIIRKIDNRRINLSDEKKMLPLNYYQYKDLQSLYLKDSLKNAVNPSKLKIYYLPNTKIILRYELLE